MCLAVVLPALGAVFGLVVGVKVHWGRYPFVNLFGFKMVVMREAGIEVAVSIISDHNIISPGVFTL